MVVVPVRRVPDSCTDGDFWNEEHSKAIRRFFGEFYGRAIADEDTPCIRRWINGADNYIMLAMHDSEWVGMAWLHIIYEPLRTTGVVNHVIVLPAHRGQGIGKALMLNLHARAGELGCTRLKLTSSPSREAAHRLYKSLGYEKRGTCVFQREL